MDLQTLADISCILNLSFLFIGIIGNSFCIYVFLQRKMIARKFNWYLLILAIFELIFCLFIFLDYLFKLMHPTKTKFRELNKFTSMLFDLSIHTTDSYLAVITLILSIDRLYAIRNPIKMKTFITNSHSKHLTFIAFVSLLLLKLPGVFLCHYNTNKTFHLMFCSLLSPIIFNIFPTIVILIVNSLLVIEIINYCRFKVIDKHNCKRDVNFEINSTSSNKQEILHQYKSIKGTQKSHFFVIIILSFWSVITTIPYYICSSYDLLFRLSIFSKYFDSSERGTERDETHQRMEFFRKIQIITSVFFNSNHCFNFLVYFRFYCMFRDCVLRVFQKCFAKIFRLRATSLVVTSEASISGYRLRTGSIFDQSTLFSFSNQKEKKIYRKLTIHSY